jgi:hypothetical protein
MGLPNRREMVLAAPPINSSEKEKEYFPSARPAIAGRSRKEPEKEMMKNEKHSVLKALRHSSY